MKILKVAGIAFLLVLVIVAGSLAQSAYRFDLLSNSINRYILTNAPGPWGVRIPMIPRPFPTGISKSEVESLLERAGYKRSGDSAFLRILSRNKTDTEIVEGRIIYDREANGLVCNKGLYVFVSFDDKEQLIYAESAIYERGCL